MLEKVTCSNIAPSLSSGNHIFYKAEYMGQSCPNQVWAITFDWSALATPVLESMRARKPASLACRLRATSQAPK